MAKITIPGLTAKQTAAGMRWYPRDLHARDHAMAASAIFATIGGRKLPELAPVKVQR